MKTQAQRDAGYRQSGRIAIACMALLAMIYGFAWASAPHAGWNVTFPPPLFADGGAADAFLADAAAADGPPPTTVEVWFSPHGGITEEVVRVIGMAKHDVYISAYGFTAIPVGDAILAAAARGVHVHIILDRSNLTSKYSLGWGLRGAPGVEVFSDSHEPIHHEKSVTIDGETVSAGSFNYSRGGELNDEDMMVIHDSRIAAKFVANWHHHLSHCVVFPARMVARKSK